MSGVELESVGPVKVMQVISVRELGLAAFIKVNGARLLGVTNRLFQLETDKSLTEWRLLYNNSCCMKHDAVVCELRHFLK